MLLCGAAILDFEGMVGDVLLTSGCVYVGITQLYTHIAYESYQSACPDYFLTFLLTILCIVPAFFVYSLVFKKSFTFLSVTTYLAFSLEFLH